jgi:hypothetical protein
VLLASLNRWSRGHASHCLVGAETAWAWWRATSDPTHRRTGDDLLLTYLRRTPGGQVDGIRSWLQNGDPDADPRVVFGSLPAEIAAIAGSLVAERDVDAGWDLMLPAVLDERRPMPEAAGTLHRAVQLAEQRKRPADAPVLQAIASRPGCPADLKAAAERVLGVLQGGP